MKRSLFSALAAVSRSVVTVQQTDLTLHCSDGTRLAARQFLGRSSSSSIQKHNILLLHGWMDNLNSFHHLAPTIAEQLPGANVVALDWPGHGQSSHKSIDAPPMVQAELAYYVHEALDQLDWIPSKDNNNDDRNSTSTTLSLVGHSLGAGVSTLYASAFPEHVNRLVLLDGAGFLPRQAQDTSKHVRSHIQKRTEYNIQSSIVDNEDEDGVSSRQPRLYRDLEVAIKTRKLAATNMPGSQSMSYECAQALVTRAITTNGSESNQEDGVYFHHDVRYHHPSIQYMTWEQMEGIFQAAGKGLPGGIGILLAEQGWPFPKHHMERTLELLQPAIVERLPGSHYFHADPDTMEAVSKQVCEFLSLSPKETQ